MSMTFELTERAISRIRLIYVCWLICSAFLILPHVYIISLFVQYMAEPGGRNSTSPVLVSLIFLNLVLECLFLLSGTSAILCKTPEALQQHFLFSYISLGSAAAISITSIFAEAGLILGVFIAVFIAKAAAFILFYVIKNAVILQSIHSPF